ncbi:hypothetical protein CDO52_10570 [Nocardiopsis gilva YIM 90087]|uniref:Uncharacterized protein n=1 Tax=Nocardiopsis gilva YIM 90087 TaxID=1235441 RepID=A0A223S4W9_9ACTN|nr:hypothetical protein [Nocardiopsis gilva]ASU83165.1 hypothetical protein CDO52_10570 [Nocardiopsis gilva YIM 90087]
MDVRSFSLYGMSALVVLAASGSCESTSYSGTSSTSCRDGNCTVTIKGTGGSGDLADIGVTEYEYRIVLNKDKSAKVMVERETSGAVDDREETSVKLGESATLHRYTVEYVSNTDEGAKFEFTQ